jgi:hypothetical protein
MRLTIAILFLPLVILAGLSLTPRNFHAFSTTILFALWMIATALCFARGFYISREHRFLGWLCVAVAVTQLALAFLPRV